MPGAGALGRFGINGIERSQCFPIDTILRESVELLHLGNVEILLIVPVIGFKQ